jgi:hypothetical protein
MQNKLRVNVCAHAEGAAVFSKPQALATFLRLAFAPPAWGRVAFVAGKAAYTCADVAEGGMDSRRGHTVTGFPRRVAGL